MICTGMENWMEHPVLNALPRDALLRVNTILSSPTACILHFLIKLTKITVITLIIHGQGSRVIKPQMLL
jgi:hypothetical protein